jgi:hypothetical protein
LNPDGIGTGAHKGVDFEVLVQRLKENPDRPTILIDRDGQFFLEAEPLFDSDMDPTPIQQLGKKFFV